MKKVYVIGALLPAGGAYMAYHVGRLLHVHFGYRLVDVNVAPVERELFAYDIPIDSISLSKLEKEITNEDLLIVNPFYSNLMLGLRLPARKIMYVQDFRTFQILDCHFDLQVAVSGLVQRYLHGAYGITAPVIPAFVQLKQMPPTKPWKERPPGSALVYMKNGSNEHKVALQYLTDSLKQSAPEINLTNIMEGRNFGRQQLLKRIGEVRYLVNMSLAEGFGLVPLEAMAMGTLVTGVDGLGGRDFLKSGKNCMTGSVRDLRLLPGIVEKAFRDEKLATACASAGNKTAQGYGYGQFKKSWLKVLAHFLKVEPSIG